MVKQVPDSNNTLVCIIILYDIIFYIMVFLLDVTLSRLPLRLYISLYLFNDN